MGRTIRFTDSSNNFKQGNASNNIELILYLLGGNDRVDLDRTDSLGGGNWVHMGAGDDYLINLSEGGNVLHLGDGNDTYMGVMSDNSFTRPSDTVNGGAGKDFFIAFTMKTNYLGGEGADKFLVSGFKNRFDGGSGRDVISYDFEDAERPGSYPVTVDLVAGRATIVAGGHDTLISIEDVVGTDDNDRILGSATGNRLVGSEGTDALTGRGGADTFVWRTAREAPIGNDGMDSITDFRRAQGDKLDLRLIDANVLISGNQSFTFIGSRAFSDRPGELSVVRQGDDIILRGDTTGDGAADFRVRLIDLSSLGSSDLLL